MDTSTEKGVQEIPMQFLGFKDVSKKKNADILPKHQLYDCAIELQDGVQPPFGSIYNLSQTELAAKRVYIHENLSKNFIWHSKSLARSPIFVCKEEGWIVVYVHKLLWTQQSYQEKSLSIIINFRAFGAIWEYKDLYED
jgi:hypothetical protein